MFCSFSVDLTNNIEIRTVLWFHDPFTMDLFFYRMKSMVFFFYVWTKNGFQGNKQDTWYKNSQMRQKTSLKWGKYKIQAVYWSKINHKSYIPIMWSALQTLYIFDFHHFSNTFGLSIHWGDILLKCTSSAIKLVLFIFFGTMLINS